MNTSCERERCWGPLCFEGLEARLLMSVARDCPEPGAPALPVDAPVTVSDADPGQDRADPAGLVQDDTALWRLGPSGWQRTEAEPDAGDSYYWESTDLPEGWHLFAVTGGEGVACQSNWARMVSPAKVVFRGGLLYGYGWFGTAYVCPWVSSTGTVFYSDLECGYWGIAGDDGKAYHPGLPAEFQQEGLRVEFSGYIRLDMISVSPGWVLELDHIALDDAEQATILKAPVYAETTLIDDGDPGIDPGVDVAWRTKWPRMLAKEAGDTLPARGIGAEPADAQDDPAQDRTTLVTRSDLLPMASRPDRDRPVEVRSFDNGKGEIGPADSAFPVSDTGRDSRASWPAAPHPVEVAVLSEASASPNVAGGIVLPDPAMEKPIRPDVTPPVKKSTGIWAPNALSFQSAPSEAIGNGAVEIEDVLAAVSDSQAAADVTASAAPPALLVDAAARAPARRR